MSDTKAKRTNQASNFGFCKECGNILLPKRRTDTLHCRICHKDFPMEENTLQVKQKKKSTAADVERKKKQSHRTAIIEETSKSPSISEEDRDAYEDFFEVSEAE